MVEMARRAGLVSMACMACMVESDWGEACVVGRRAPLRVRVTVRVFWVRVRVRTAQARQFIHQRLDETLIGYDLQRYRGRGARPSAHGHIERHSASPPEPQKQRPDPEQFRVWGTERVRPNGWGSQGIRRWWSYPLHAFTRV